MKKDAKAAPETAGPPQDERPDVEEERAEEPASAASEETDYRATPEAEEAGWEENVLRRVEDLENQVKKYEDNWKRAEADLDTYRRRARLEREETEARAKEQVLSELMSLADDLERALDAAEKEEKTGPIYDGVHLVHGRVRDIFASHGIEVIDPVGKAFDPHVADAMMTVETEEHTPGVVVQVIEKGYRRGDRVLRAAKVTVAKAPETQDASGS